MEVRLDAIHNEDCLEGMGRLPDNSVDLIATDPPYGIAFMGRAWDKAIPSVDIWRECLRVLKPGAFAFVMCIPRQGCLARMVVSLEDAGFVVSFTSIYWAYASGFPKAQNIGKAVDKRNAKTWTEQLEVAKYIRQKMADSKTSKETLNKQFNSVAKANHWTALDFNNFCMPILKDYRRLKIILGLDNRFDKLIERAEAERKVIGEGKSALVNPDNVHAVQSSRVDFEPKEYNITAPATPQAQALDGSYAGFQPKPAVEVVLVAMKPLSEKTYVDQALQNGKGVTWLDGGRIPYEGKLPKNYMGATKLMEDRPWTQAQRDGERERPIIGVNTTGRFPANLLASDDALNDGRGYETHSMGYKKAKSTGIFGDRGNVPRNWTRSENGSFSRYFSLDQWWRKKLEELDKLSSKAYNKEKNKGEMLWEASQVGEDPGSKSSDLSVDGVKRSSLITGATEQEEANFAHHPVPPDSDSQGQSQDAKSAARKLDSTETDIARRLAQIKQDTETLLQMLESESITHIAPKKSTLFSQDAASYVAGKLRDLRDIIQMSINQPRLFGSVIPVIIKQMQQDLSQDRLWQSFWQERIKLLPKSQRRTFPFAIISKASKAEKNRGCEGLEEKELAIGNKQIYERSGSRKPPQTNYLKRGNYHPTCKPIKLMSYLITLGSREGDIVLDPFIGSGTTAIAAKMLKRHFIGFETESDYCRIAEARLRAVEERLI